MDWPVLAKHPTNDEGVSNQNFGIYVTTVLLMGACGAAWLLAKKPKNNYGGKSFRRHGMRTLTIVPSRVLTKSPRKRINNAGKHIVGVVEEESR